MHGNVWEWVEDCYSDSYKDAPNAGGVARGNCDRVLRGGSWYYRPEGLRSAFRGGYKTPGHRDDIGDGFRVARTLR